MPIRTHTVSSIDPTSLNYCTRLFTQEFWHCIVFTSRFVLWLLISKWSLTNCLWFSFSFIHIPLQLNYTSLSQISNWPIFPYIRYFGMVYRRENVLLFGSTVYNWLRKLVYKGNRWPILSAQLHETFRFIAQTN